MVLLSGCNIINNLIHDDQVVAKAAGKKLYRSDLAKYIPDGVSPADSANMAEQYIKSWASNLLFTKKAQRELSKEEQDMDKELEEYRMSLLKYRYEQLYINALDTSISKNRWKIIIRRIKKVSPWPVLSEVRYIHLMKDSQNREEIIDSTGRGGSEQEDLDSLAI